MCTSPYVFHVVHIHVGCDVHVWLVEVCAVVCTSAAIDECLSSHLRSRVEQLQNHVGKLEKENERLKQQLQQTKLGLGEYSYFLYPLK